MTPVDGHHEHNNEAQGMSTSSGSTSNKHRIAVAPPMDPMEVERVEEAPPSVESSDRSTTRKSQHGKSHSQNRKNRRNSLELRNLPVSIIFASEYRDADHLRHDDDDHEGENSKDGANGVSGSNRSNSFRMKNGCLRRTCLNSKLSLRTQMMLTFGIVSAFTIGLVVSICIAVSIMSGDEVKKITRQSFDKMIDNKEGDTARYLAESLSLRLMPQDLVQLLHDATQDRFMGYPNVLDDSGVPFLDMETHTNKYPLRGFPAPLDWQMMEEPYIVTDDNFEEHVQTRRSWFQKEAALSTAHSAYYMQGMCDPDAAPGSQTYFPNCTSENNDIITGGVISPTPTNRHVYDKLSDLGPLLKALFEFYADVKELGIYTANGGAGGTLVFPHYELNTSTSYVSIGCNWLLDPHPLAGERLIGTLDDFERCEAKGIHVKDAVVPSRLYSPMDREWCKKQAQNPQKLSVYGPYMSAWHETEWLMSVGQAVYDRVTQEFIGCIGVDYVLHTIDALVKNSVVTNHSHVTLVRFNEEGTVVSSSAWNMSYAFESITVDNLEVGMSNDSYYRLRNLVDFDLKWDPREVRDTFEQFRVDEDGYQVSAYPLPPPPETYDTLYRPEFFAISSVSISDVNDEVDTVCGAVSDTVEALIFQSLIVGVGGLLLVIVLIFMVSHSMTLPLKYMNGVSSEIVDSFGEVKDEDEEAPVNRTKSETKCSPRTELSDVVKQFQKMVDRFSGTAMARSMKINVSDIENRFTQQEDFKDLYSSRDEPSFLYKYSEEKNLSIEDTNGTPFNDVVPSRLHYGSIVNEATKMDTSTPTIHSSDIHMHNTSLTSPLFFWILALIVSPLLITTVGISAFVTYNISEGLFDIISDAKAEYMYLEKFSLSVYAGLRASYGALTMRKSLRDNFILMRYSSWLLFGGLQRSDSFIDLISGADECKDVLYTEKCDAVSAIVCDCDWNDRFGRFGQCDNLDNVDARYLQKTSFVGLAEDILPGTGDRVSTSYPNIAYSPATTTWWEVGNITSMPGSEKGANASGYDTTYDRLRVSSAFPFFQTFYNSESDEKNFIAGFIFYEADGLGVGYEGCSAGILSSSQFVSSKSNGASEIRPELCPLGKYGFDPRCRGWYEAGMNSNGLYVSPPYMFENKQVLFGQSCTSPLRDPFTGEHVGQTLVDFISEQFFDALNSKNTKLAEGGFPVVITGLDDAFGADTVIAPGFSLHDDGSSLPIGDVLLPYDKPCPAEDCTRRLIFEDIRKRMKNGESDVSEFVRTTSQGSREVFYIAFAPVKTRMLVPVNSSDVTTGVNASDYVVYSLGLVQPQRALFAQFKEMEDKIRKQVDITTVVLALLICFSIILVLYISNRITQSMIEPMVYLLELIRYINGMVVDGTAPGLEIDRSYGSREISNVVDTMETLCRIVEIANVAFFAGDVEKAYVVLADAARLFRRLNNSKAEGVANNNLGNTMLAFYRTMLETNVDRVAGFSKREVIRKGMGYFHRAIQLGEKAYEEFHTAEGWSPRCLEFMQHLSNRYFNRAMFLLTVKNGHESPGELEALGLRDLQIAKDMDVEIVDQGSEVGWTVRGVEKIFDVYLNRIRGHLLLLDMGYEDQWDTDELIDQASDLLKKEFRNLASSPLFFDFSPAGRMQQIETELMKYKVIQGELSCAAKIAIRMLFEDERTLPEAQLIAVETLAAYMDSQRQAERGQDNDEDSASGARDELAVYQLWLADANEENDRSRSTTTSDEASMPKSLKMSIRKVFASEDDQSPSNTSRIRMSSLRASTRGDVTMEIF